MSYEPTLVINKTQLEEHIWSIDKSRDYSDDEDDRAKKYLIGINSNHDTLDFECIKLVVCSPSITSFNKSVRNILDEYNINFKTHW